jgi:hypothetical protein
MTNDWDVSKIQALLGSAQQLRTHWSSLITHVMNFAILTNVAVWTLFIQAYIGSFRETQIWDHAYLALASTVSIVLLFLWRWYTKYLDSNIAHLYPELIYFEGELSCPSRYGTSAYLKRNLGKAGGCLHKITDYKQKAEVVARLVEKKLMGGRAHDIINWLILALVVILALIVFGLGIFEFPRIGGGATEHGLVRCELKWLCGIISIVGIVGMILLLATGQRKPSKKRMQAIITQVMKDKTEN